MFDLKSFIKKGLLDAVGKTADHQIVLCAAYWFDKRVLTEADMIDIKTALKPTRVIAQLDNEDLMPADDTCDNYTSDIDDYVSLR